MGAVARIGPKRICDLSSGYVYSSSVLEQLSPSPPYSNAVVAILPLPGFWEITFCYSVILVGKKVFSFLSMVGFKEKEPIWGILALVVPEESRVFVNTAVRWEMNCCVPIVLLVASAHSAGVLFPKWKEMEEARFSGPLFSLLDVWWS
ncbi:hypothetical protein TNIN_81451 [Trichonephila inaurata madagascariensis]|uniref:Uncharacterized protein n=1 Tax=Trichonephila inaurata madagascariensis TaxID=2747483 RepID=A0A8X6I410_9ARAC|nr:hypothetical protein TNIN_81451 [Trichonephila inaurata madagascariensis]